jgi:hypothetical protein
VEFVASGSFSESRLKPELRAREVNNEKNMKILPFPIFFYLVLTLYN